MKGFWTAYAQKCKDKCEQDKDNARSAAEMPSEIHVMNQIDRATPAQDKQDYSCSRITTKIKVKSHGLDIT